MGKLTDPAQPPSPFLSTAAHGRKTEQPSCHARVKDAPHAETRPKSQARASTGDGTWELSPFRTMCDPLSHTSQDVGRWFRLRGPSWYPPNPTTVSVRRAPRGAEHNCCGLPKTRNMGVASAVCWLGDVTRINQLSFPRPHTNQAWD